MIIIEEASIGAAWLKAFEQTSENRGVAKPMSVTFSQVLNSDSTDKKITEYLDKRLIKDGMPSTHTVSNTIFPISLWNPNSPRKILFDLYEQGWERISACKNNRKGTYFRRMTSFQGGKEPVNQIEHVINFWTEGRRRHSAFQLAIFSPEHDHTKSPYGAFPCLHQVSITPHGAHGKDGISVTGYYATQYIYNKALGNYIGL